MKTRGVWEVGINLLPKLQFFDMVVIAASIHRSNRDIPFEVMIQKKVTNLTIIT